MPRTNRREFLKRTGVGVAGLAAISLPENLIGEESLASAIPLHQELPVFGVHAYPMQHSVAAGEELALHVSSTVPYQLGLYRLGLEVDNPETDILLHRFLDASPTPQPIHPGSYVHIEKGLPIELSALTLECWVRPWRVDAAAGLITQLDHPQPGGVGLLLAANGGLIFYLGGEHATAPNQFKRGEWHHVVATWDGQQKCVWLNGQRIAEWNFSGKVDIGSAPLRLGASGEQGKAAKFLDGDLAYPTIYSRALTSEEIQDRWQRRGLRVPRTKGELARWNFSEERGERVADSSGQRWHGRIINHGTWMIGGPSFDPNVVRFDRYDPAKDSKRGHSLRLASDDLYDCRWQVTHRYQIPGDAKSGIYVARFDYQQDGQPRRYHCTFIVRKPARRRKAPILMLCATNTWRAYSGTPFAPMPAEQYQVWGTDGIKNAANNPPAYNLYHGHAAGQGTYQMGLRMPWPAAGPYVLYGGPTKYSHLMRADRFAQIWLEREGYAFDVISDVDLHRDPDQLRGYDACFINGHNEYWSLPMYHGLERYLKQGGNVVCLSGNSLFWRVSFDEYLSVMECRKVDAPGEQVPAARRGESWHSHDGMRGGMMRECGYPGWKLIGLETLGWNNQGNSKNFGPYLVDQADHFLFHQPEELNLKPGDAFGQRTTGAFAMANGHEMDIRLSTLAALQEQPTPGDAVMPVDPTGMLRLANGVIPWKEGGAAFDYFFRGIRPKNDQGGEMIYWERVEGGRVFNAGSIGSGWALEADPKFQGLMRNVLAHFGVKKAI